MNHRVDLGVWGLVVAATAVACSGASESGDDDDTSGTGGTGAVMITGGTSGTGGAVAGTGGTGGAVAGTGGTGGTIGGTGGTIGGTGGAVAGTGGTGGSTGGNSAGGVSGNPMCPTPPAQYTSPVIDDLEDGDDSVPTTDGRGGFWYTFNDGTETGTQMPPPGQGLFSPAAPGANGTAYAAYTSGQGFVGTQADPPALSSPGFARMAMPLRQVGGEYCAFDASTYTGVTFWARGDVSVYFRVTTVNSTPTNQGGMCIAQCLDHFSTVLALTDTWEQYSVLWSDLSPRYDLTSVFAVYGLLEFQWEVMGDPAAGAFEYAVDEIAFIEG